MILEISVLVFTDAEVITATKICESIEYAEYVLCVHTHPLL